MQEIFKSENTNDEFLIILIKKSHKAIFKLKMIDDASEHINLVSLLIKKLKKEDIKWVELKLMFTPIIPSNTIYYINKYNGNFVCHVEDFEKFYLSNAKNVIHLNNVFCDPARIDENGWIKVSGYKTEKKIKFNKLQNELQGIGGDWNIM